MNALPPLTRSDRAATLVIALRSCPLTACHRDGDQAQLSDGPFLDVGWHSDDFQRLDARRHVRRLRAKKNTYGGRLISSRRLSPGGGCARSLEPIARAT